ncbi:MAG TPA: extracellular solute-binding protein, partial [Anaerolineae bacterium]|nr:extracellular solute-binding protein [Anaerolineae bacterium]
TPLPVSSAITLTLWTTEPFSPAQEGPSGEVLAEQVQTFMEAHPDVVVEYVLKKPHGKGGILHLLRATEAVLPQALPDIVVLDDSQLGEAARAGLLQPWDDLVAPELINDLFPFAQEAGRVDGRLVGLLFEADIEHLVYNTNKLEAPPLRWTDVLTEGGSYIFPAGGKEGAVNDAFLIQYLALGGRLLDEAGAPALDEGKVAQVLQFYREGRDKGVIPESVLEFHTLDDCWPPYLSAEVAASHVSSHRYLTDRGLLRNTAFAAIPTRDGVVVTIGHGWAYALVARDPARQAAAAQFITWLMAPENLAAWNQAVLHVPPRRLALAAMATHRLADHRREPGDALSHIRAKASTEERSVDAYTEFLKGQLEKARVRPSGPSCNTLARVLQRAVQDVLTGAATPEEAAAQAVAQLE